VSRLGSARGDRAGGPRLHGSPRHRRLARSLLNITLAGGWFGLLAWRTGGILAPTLAHAGYNWAEEMLFGATPNPGISPFGALFDVDLTGPVRLGGSADGLNASLLLTAVLAAIILPLLLRGSPGRAQAEAKQETRPGS
jgi:uncharacterized protein